MQICQRRESNHGRLPPKYATAYYQTVEHAFCSCSLVIRDQYNQWPPRAVVKFAAISS